MTRPGPIALASLLFLFGCSSPVALDSRDPYPERIRQTSQLDIQAIRRDTSLTITNTSARVFGPSTIWINKWFGLPIKGLAIGETVTIILNSFRDLNNEGFRAGGFFATERPDRVVITQIQTEDELIGLVTVDRETK